MKELLVILEPTGVPQPLSDLEPGIFIMLDENAKACSAGVKSEYGDGVEGYASYNEAGEFCGEVLAMPAKVTIREEEL